MFIFTRARAHIIRKVTAACVSPELRLRVSGGSVRTPGKGSLHQVQGTKLGSGASERFSSPGSGRQPSRPRSSQPPTAPEPELHQRRLTV